MNTDRIGRTEARRLAEEEFQRFAELAAALTPQEWAMPTDCTAWDVRTIALHVLGSADAQASVAEFAHQLRRSASVRSCPPPSSSGSSRPPARRRSRAAGELRRRCGSPRCRSGLPLAGGR